MAAYLARFKGASCYHTESDLRCYLAWCAAHGLGPLAARRPHLELYIRWMRDPPVQAFHRFPAVLGGRRVLPDLRHRRPAGALTRRACPPPSLPPESPTLGFTHLQFEALLTASRESPRPCDFALIAMLGLLGLRIFEATGADITDLGEEHGHRVLRVCGKGTNIVRLPLPPAVGRAIDQAAGFANVQIAARHTDPRTTMRYDRARKNLDRHPEMDLACLHGLRHLTAIVSLAEAWGDARHCRIE